VKKLNVLLLCRGRLTCGHGMLLAPNFGLHGNKKAANINVKNKVYKTVIGDAVAHINRKNSPFRQICNVLYYYYQ